MQRRNYKKRNYKIRKAMELKLCLNYFKYHLLFLNI